MNGLTVSFFHSSSEEFFCVPKELQDNRYYYHLSNFNIKIPYEGGVRMFGQREKSMCYFNFFRAACFFFTFTKFQWTAIFFPDGFFFLISHQRIWRCLISHFVTSSALISEQFRKSKLKMSKFGWISFLINARSFFFRDLSYFSHTKSNCCQFETQTLRNFSIISFFFNFDRNKRSILLTKESGLITFKTKTQMSPWNIKREVMLCNSTPSDLNRS